MPSQLRRVPFDSLFEATGIQPIPQRSKQSKQKKRKKKAVGTSILDASLELDADTRDRLRESVVNSASPLRKLPSAAPTVPRSNAKWATRDTPTHGAARDLHVIEVPPSRARPRPRAQQQQQQQQHDDREAELSNAPDQAQAQHHLEHLIQLHHDREAAMSRPPVDDRAVVECEIGAGQCPNILLLSNELLLLILDNLDSYDLLSVRRTCRLFATLAPLASAWRQLTSQQDLHGTTPLHVACFTGNLDGVAYLLARGADPAAIDITGVSPIDIARRLGHDSIAWLLAKQSLYHTDSVLRVRRQHAREIE